jgi:hypothetical protein
MRRNRHRRVREIQERIERLTEEQERSDRQLETVLGREPGMRRFAREMADIRERDHFTELFINVVGARRT